MAQWLTAYCTRSVQKITAADLLKAINDIEDIHMLAESYGIDDDDAVDDALEKLRITDVTEPDGVKFRLRYRDRRLRPIDIWFCGEPTRVAVERDDALEQFEGDKRRGVSQVRAHVAKVIEVVALELGGNQLEDMGIVFAGHLAEFFAIEGQGLIRDQNDDWWAMSKRRPSVASLVVGRRR